jgi:DtxR family Mn-dependent transcriptional regulator
MTTSTVEDYLKCIHREQRAGDTPLVATGRIAQEMGVAPGTVTAMMKTLTEAGLTEYEPYMGVRLTEQGHLLAAHVLRRHRLVELFLVRVMGMDWSSVHEDAEILEHAVSDKLIERMDEMLGHPTVDPHGDPIPTPTGRLDENDDPSLLACQLNCDLRITRVTDQRSEFLLLLEQHQLMPGRMATVEQRDELTETVQIKPDGGKPLRLGFQAASRILVGRP